MRWGDILRDFHEIYIWLFCSHQTQTINYVNGLLHTIELFRLPNDSITNIQALIFDMITLLIDCHSIGFEFLRLSGGRILLVDGEFQVENVDIHCLSDNDLERWDICLHYLSTSLL